MVLVGVVESGVLEKVRLGGRVWSLCVFGYVVLDLIFFFIWEGWLVVV